MTTAERVLRRYALDMTTVTVDHLEKWKKDLRMLTKIYKAVGLEDDERDRASWHEARSLFRRFSDNFENWVYRVLLPKVSKSEQSYLHKEIATKAWTAKASIDSYALFPDQHDGGPGHGRIPAPWKLRHERDKNIVKYQRAFNDAFKTMSDFIEYHPSKMDRVVDEVLSVGGATIIVQGYGRGEMGEGDVEPFLRSLDGFISRINRAGFSAATKGLTVRVDFDGKEALTAGIYHAGEDMIRILPLGVIGMDGGTFTHEVGHRFWFREVTNQGRAHWTEVMESRGAKITQDDIDRFFELVAKKKQSEWREYDPGRSEMGALVNQIARDELEAAKFRTLGDTPPTPIMGGNKSYDPIEYKKRLEWKLGEVAIIDEISEYAASGGPIEAFAEVFRKYVIKGPGSIPPFVLQLFKNVCRSGGAKLASLEERVLVRFLNP